MDDYFAGITTWWGTQSANAFYTGIGGRLRNNIARQDEVKPYCVYSQITGDPEFFLDDNYDELYHMENQFDIYSESNVEVLDLAKKAMALFDNASFAITGWGMFNFKRVRNLLMPRNIFEEQTLDFMLHRYLISYEVTMQKNRA